MSLFPSTLTGRILDDGVTEPPVIELQGISAGQLATVLTAYTPLETTTQNTADIGTNAAAIAALQGQVAALPAAPDLTPYALASDLAAAEGLIAANASGLTAVNTSLTQGLATKASQSALDALQVEVDGKSTPAGVGQSSDHGSHEQRCDQRQQRHPGNCGRDLCAEVGRGPAGPGRGGPPDGRRRRPGHRHGSAPPGQHQRPQRRCGSPDHARGREPAHRNGAAPLRPTSRGGRRAGPQGLPAGWP